MGLVRFRPGALLLGAGLALIDPMVCPSSLFAQGDGTFRSPLRIAVRGPVALATGDFNADGRLDLAALNGAAGVTALLQDPSDRGLWTSRDSLGGGYFLHAADFDEDGNADLLTADPGSYAYFLRSLGDGTFARGVALPQSRGARGLAVGDWNGDGELDVASANHDGLTIAVFLGKGDGSFTFLQYYRPGDEPHALESLDYDGDGLMDLVVGLPTGLRALKGNGDGGFVLKNIGGAWAGCHGFIERGDFNGDGKGDLITSCAVGLGLGDGTFKRSIPLPGYPALVDDLDGDGKDDLAVVLNRGVGSAVLAVLRGNGNATFRPPLLFPAQVESSFLLSRDLDGDGRTDVVAADPQSSAVAVIWGSRGERFLDAGRQVSGFTTARVVGVTDLDGDGKADVVIPTASPDRVHIYLAPGFSEPTVPTLTVSTESAFTCLETADLDGDGVPDLAGANRTKGLALVALLEPSGQVRAQVVKLAGTYPSAVIVDRLDADDIPDLAIACTGSNAVSVFLGLGGGRFADARPVPSLDKPRDLAAGDLDGDGWKDLAVISNQEVWVQYGAGSGEFLPPVSILKDPAASHSDVAIADLDLDRLGDLLVLNYRASTLRLFRGMDGRRFETRLLVDVVAGPISIAVADLDGDGLPDITAAGSIGRSVTVILNRGDQGLTIPIDYWLGLSVMGHRIADFNLDGALDILAYHGNSALILPGRPRNPPSSRFIRGDSSGDGQVEVGDAIAILNRLFLGGDPVPCEDGADADDDGELGLSDPIAILRRLFLGGEALPPPAEACGEDPVADGLPDCRIDC